MTVHTGYWWLTTLNNGWQWSTTTTNQYQPFISYPNLNPGLSWNYPDYRHLSIINSQLPTGYHRKGAFRGGTPGSASTEVFLFTVEMGISCLDSWPRDGSAAMVRRWSMVNHGLVRLNMVKSGLIDSGLMVHNGWFVKRMVSAGNVSEYFSGLISSNHAIIGTNHAYSWYIAGMVKALVMAISRAWSAISRTERRSLGSSPWCALVAPWWFRRCLDRNLLPGGNPSRHCTGCWCCLQDTVPRVMPKHNLNHYVVRGCWA